MNSYGKFTPAKGRRQILIADDEIINREILGEMLRSEYDIIFACDGAETMEMIEKNQDAISLVLLDVLMPVMSGLEVLKKAKADPRYARIPFIVMTGEKDTEIESLKLARCDRLYPQALPGSGRDQSTYTAYDRAHGRQRHHRVYRARFAYRPL